MAGRRVPQRPQAPPCDSDTGSPTNTGPPGTSRVHYAAGSGTLLPSGRPSSLRLGRLRTQCSSDALERSAAISPTRTYPVAGDRPLHVRGPLVYGWLIGLGSYATGPGTTLPPAGPAHSDSDGLALNCSSDALECSAANSPTWTYPRCRRQASPRAGPSRLRADIRLLLAVYCLPDTGAGCRQLDSVTSTFLPHLPGPSLPHAGQDNQ